MSNGNHNQGAQRAHANMSLEVKIERDFGGVKITYGLVGTYQIGSFSELQAAYDELRAQVEVQHELSQKNRPQLMPQQLKQQTNANQTIVLCTTLRRNVVSGKDQIRLLGGEFSTHGIACYPEFFEALKIDPEHLAIGDNPYHDYVLVQLDSSGNPKRALSVVDG